LFQNDFIGRENGWRRGFVSVPATLGNSWEPIDQQQLTPPGDCILGERVYHRREQHQMNNERKSSKAGERAAEGLREATAKEEAKNESKTGQDVAKGADRFEERTKSSDGKSAQEKQKE
jgi:hypothetical protein